MQFCIRKVLRKEQNKRREQEDNVGAIDIQRIFRGKLGRRVVFKIRHAEEELHRVVEGRLSFHESKGKGD